MFFNKVSCTCPSGIEQESHNNNATKSNLHVCKHANSVLQIMIDSQAVKYEDIMLKNEQVNFEIAAAEISRSSLVTYYNNKWGTQ